MSADRLLVNEQVDEVEIPGADGLLRRPAGAHAAARDCCRSGELWYRQGQEKHYLSIAFGFAEVQPDRVTILAQIAERADEIDVARAEAAKKRAEERLAKPTTDMDFERARIALLKSLDPPAGRAVALEFARELFANLANLVRYRGLIQSLVARELKARYRGSVLGFFWSFINPLLLLLIYSFVFTMVMPNTLEGRAALRAVHVLRHPAVDLVLVVADRGGRLAHHRRQPDQEGAVSRRGAADRQRAGEHGALLPRPADSDRVPDLLPALRPTRRTCSGFRSRCSCSCLHARRWRSSVGADRALPRHPRHPVERADALVLRDADHLPLVPANVRGSEAAVRPEPVHPPGRLVPGDPVLHGPIGHWKWLLALGVASVVLFLAGYWLFDRLRDSFAEAV